MTVLRTLSHGLVMAGFTCALASTAAAQASRTWVSALGDDVNPCSRLAPCKTFAGAHSKTAPRGEINAVDPGGFGPVTITKAITIDGHDVEAGILAGDVNGVIISAGANDVVILRNLDINGFGTGINGVRILQARDVYIENCLIYGFTNRGISDERSAGQLFVSNTTIANNGQTGITLVPTNVLTGPLHGTLTNVRLHRNGNAGLALSKGTKATVSHSVASGNVNAGFYADGAGAVSELTLADSVSAANGQGVNAQSGGIVRISNTVITANVSGLLMAGASVFSYGNNRIDGNTFNNGPPNGSLTEQ